MPCFSFIDTIGEELADAGRNDGLGYLGQVEWRVLPNETAEDPGRLGIVSLAHENFTHILKSVVRRNRNVA